MNRPLDDLGPLDRYTRASEKAAATIIGAYSTSFGAATQLLGQRHRSHVRNIYALARVADELVDGATAEAEMPTQEQRFTLDQLEEEVEVAVQSGYSSNPIVHAFAYTARTAAIDEELTRPFFSSMRTDLTRTLPGDAQTGHSASLLYFGDTEHADYVFGSAEVVGLMCLRVFIRDESPSSGELAVLMQGARRLGAAFQNVNFLRDLADDTERLGRSYLSENGTLDDDARSQWVAVIRAQLAEAQLALPLLPTDARAAVGAALRLFDSLTTRIARTSVEDLYRRRVRVPTLEKSWLIAQAVLEVQKGRLR